MRYINFCKWTSTVCFILAAILLSTNIEISRYGFFIFLVGHAIGFYAFYKLKDLPLTLQNFFFMFVDGWGIYRWFIT